MKTRFYNGHVATTRNKDGRLQLQMCQEGITCPICSQVLDKAIRKELELWTDEEFNGREKYVISLEWLFPISFVETDPLFFDNLENRVENFLEKNERMKGLYRMDLQMDSDSIQLTLLLLAPYPFSLKVSKEAIDEWYKLYPTEVYYRDMEWLDKYEFFVWSAPFTYKKEEKEFLKSMSSDSVLKDRLLERIVILE